MKLNEGKSSEKDLKSSSEKSYKNKQPEIIKYSLELKVMTFNPQNIIFICWKLICSWSMK